MTQPVLDRPRTAGEIVVFARRRRTARRTLPGASGPRQHIPTEQDGRLEPGRMPGATRRRCWCHTGINHLHGGRNRLAGVLLPAIGGKRGGKAVKEALASGLATAKAGPQTEAPGRYLWRSGPNSRSTAARYPYRLCRC